MEEDDILSTVAEGGVSEKPENNNADVEQASSSQPTAAHKNGDFEFPVLAMSSMKEYSETYKMLNQVGEGAYGSVYMAKHKKNGGLCALKKMKIDSHQEGFPLTSVREIQIALKVKRHPNLASLKDVSLAQDGEQLVAVLAFEYLEFDLAGVLMSGYRIPTKQILPIFHQILKGLFALHTPGIVHRDLKASNVLISKAGVAKICDFGLSREISRGDHVTPNVVTMWYRPPELLMGAPYNYSIDIWSAGCLLAEMFLGKTLFRGSTEAEQLSLIMEKCGSPNETNWAGVSTYKGYTSITVDRGRCLAEYLTDTCRERRKGLLDSKKRGIPPTAISLIDSMLALDPNKRPSVSKCIHHRYFYCDADSNFIKDVRINPIPLEVPGWPHGCHEWQVKEGYLRQRKQPQIVHQQHQPKWDKGGKDGGKGVQAAKGVKGGVKGTAPSQNKGGERMREQEVDKRKRRRIEQAAGKHRPQGAPTQQPPSTVMQQEAPPGSTQKVFIKAAK